MLDKHIMHVSLMVTMDGENAHKLVSMPKCIFFYFALMEYKMTFLPSSSTSQPSISTTLILARHLILFVIFAFLPAISYKLYYITTDLPKKNKFSK